MQGCAMRQLGMGRQMLCTTVQHTCVVDAGAVVLMHQHILHNTAAAECSATTMLQALLLPVLVSGLRHLRLDDHYYYYY
jgi:hypothetical protein